MPRMISIIEKVRVELIFVRENCFPEEITAGCDDALLLLACRGTEVAITDDDANPHTHTLNEKQLQNASAFRISWTSWTEKRLVLCRYITSSSPLTVE